MSWLAPIERPVLANTPPTTATASPPARAPRAAGAPNTIATIVHVGIHHGGRAVAVVNGVAARVLRAGVDLGARLPAVVVVLLRPRVLHIVNLLAEQQRIPSGVQRQLAMRRRGGGE